MIPRFKILRRDGFRCVYCGATPDVSKLHVDHYQPRSKGGTDHPLNLRTACVHCNTGKRNMEPEWNPCTFFIDPDFFNYPEYYRDELACIGFDSEYLAADGPPVKGEGSCL